MSEPTDNGRKGLPRLHRIGFGLMALVPGFPTGLIMYGLLHSLDLGHVLFAAVVFMMAFGMALSVLSFDNRVRYQLRGALLVGFAIGTLAGALLTMSIPIPSS